MDAEENEKTTDDAREEIANPRVRVKAAFRKFGDDDEEDAEEDEEIVDAMSGDRGCHTFSESRTSASRNSKKARGAIAAKFW